MAIPKDLQEVIGQKEIRYSLRTGSLREGKYRARRMAGYTQSLFRRLRTRKKGLAGMNVKFSNGAVKKLLEEYLKEVLNDAEEMRRDAKRPMSREDLDDQLFTLSIFHEEAKEELALNDYRKASSQIDLLLEERGLQIDKDSETYRLFCREWLKTSIRFYEIELKRATGDYSDEDIKISYPQALPHSTPEEPPGEKLTKVIEIYKRDLKKGKRWTPKTESEMTATLKTFVEIVGDRNIKTITRDKLRIYKNILMKLPPNRRKDKRYKDKPIIEILKMKDVKPLSITTVNNQLVKISGFFNYALKEGFVDRNPAEQMQVPTSKRADELRSEFTPEDLTALFHSQEYLQDKHKESFNFWIPVLALFTGMRLEELSQLYLDDIKEIDGV